MRKKGYLYAALGAMGWGTTFIATKIVITPVSVLLLAMPVLGEKPTAKKLLAIVLTVAGALLVIGKAGGGSPCAVGVEGR